MVHSKLHSLMKEQELTVAQVAQRTGLHRNTITLLKTGTAQQVNLDTLDQLCQLFKCTTGDIIEFVPTHENTNAEKEVCVAEQNAPNDSLTSVTTSINHDNWISTVK